MGKFQDFIGETIGSFAGTWLGIGAKTLGAEAGKEVAAKTVAPLFTQKHYETLQSVSDALDEPYHRIYTSRLLEAVRVGRDDWMVGLLGRYLEDLTGRDKHEALMVFLSYPHKIGRMSLSRLRDEWENPKKSEFLARLHGLDNNPVTRAMRRLAEEADEAIDATETRLHDICRGRGWHIP